MIEFDYAEPVKQAPSKLAPIVPSIAPSMPQTAVGGGSPPLIPPIAKPFASPSNGGNWQGKSAATPPATPSIPFHVAQARAKGARVKATIQRIEKRTPRKLITAELAKLAAWREANTRKLESVIPETPAPKLIARRWQAWREGREIRIAYEGEAGFEAEEFAA